MRHCSRWGHGGGLVSWVAQIDETVYIGPDARVIGRAVLMGSSRIEDHGIVRGGMVKDSIVSGRAVVEPRGILVDGMRMSGTMVLRGSSNRLPLCSTCTGSGGECTPCSGTGRHWGRR